MATNVTEVDDLTSCPVCFEDFSEEGPQVPRILPCFHTLCEHCVEHLLQNNNSLECPECREKHEAPRGVKSFQQNKYIIAYVRKNRKSTPKVALSQERARCPDHGEDMTMFCRDGACERAICHLCLLKSHQFHNVVDVEEERKENYRILVDDIEEASNLLTSNKETIRAVQEILENQYEKSLIMLKNRKEELVRTITEHMGELVAELCKGKTDRDAEIENEMETIETNIGMIRSLQDDVNEMTTLEEIKFKREIVNNVCDEIKKRNPNKTGFSILEYAPPDQINPDTLEHLCGKTERKVHVSSTAREEQNYEEEVIKIQQNSDVPIKMQFQQKGNSTQKFTKVDKTQQARQQLSELSPKQKDPQGLIVDGSTRTRYRDSPHLKDRLQIINQNVSPDFRGIIERLQLQRTPVYRHRHMQRLVNQNNK